MWTVQKDEEIEEISWSKSIFKKGKFLLNHPVQCKGLAQTTTQWSFLGQGFFLVGPEMFYRFWFFYLFWQWIPKNDTRSKMHRTSDKTNSKLRNIHCRYYYKTPVDTTINKIKVNKCTKQNLSSLTAHTRL